MTKARKTVFVLGVVSLVVAITLARTSKHSIYNQYVCTACGLERAVYKRRVGPVTYHEEVTLQTSPLSRALKIKDCPHSWLLYRFGQSSGFLLRGWTTHMD